MAVRTYAWIYPSSQAGKLATITAKFYQAGHPHSQVGPTFSGSGTPADGIIFEVPDYPGAYAVRLDLGTEEGFFIANTGGSDPRPALCLVEAVGAGGGGGGVTNVNIEETNVDA